MSGRNEYIDIVKGLGILCVYLGHSFYSATMPWRVIFAFHMPLFLIVSGWLYKPEKEQNFVDMFRRVWRTLMLPYLFFYVVSSLFHVPHSLVLWYRAPVGSLKRLLHDGAPALWFLMCLSSIHVLLWGCNKVRRTSFLQERMFWFVLCVGFCIVAQFVNLFVPMSIRKANVPFMLLSVPCCAFFFAFGAFVRSMSRVLHAKWGVDRVYVSVYAIVCGVSLYLLLPESGRDVFNLRVAQFDVTMLPICACGVMAVLLLAYLIVGGKGRVISSMRVPLAYIGCNSLCYFALEFPVAYIWGNVMALIGVNGCIELLYSVSHPHWIGITRVVFVLIGVTLMMPLMAKIIPSKRGLKVRYV